MGVGCDVQCLCNSVSASESDSDDSDEGNSSMQDECQITSVKEEEILTAYSGESTAGEDDFNPLETRDQRMKVTCCRLLT